MRRLAVMSVVCVLAFGVALQAKEKPSSSPLVGTWNCIAHGGSNGDTHFTLSLQESADGLTGYVSAEQGDADITSITFKNDRLKIDVDAGQNDYGLTGTLNKGKLTGTWYLNGQKQGSWGGTK